MLGISGQLPLSDNKLKAGDYPGGGIDYPGDISSEL